MEWPQLLPSRFSSGLTRYSAACFFLLPHFSDLGKTGMVCKGTSELSHIAHSHAALFFMD